MPSRIIDRETGGNTTYARHLARGLVRAGVEVGRMPAARHPAATMLLESVAGLRGGQADEVLHYVADTGPLLKTRAPSVVTVHGVASRWIDIARTPRQERVWRGRVARAIASTDHVITVSQSSARDITEVFGVAPAKLTTIEHGIDVDRFAADVPLSDALRARLPDRFVLYLGNLEPRKNLVELVRAFAMPEVRALGVKLVIAGKAAWNAEESLRAIAASEDVVHVGFVDDQDRTALMRACELFVFPSLYEGFGFPVLEALAAGAVVVTSDRGSLAEVAGPALTLPSLDAEGIAAGIVNGLTDDDARGRCLDAGVRWASKYTWAESVRRHLDVYRGVLSQ